MLTFTLASKSLKTTGCSVKMAHTVLLAWVPHPTYGQASPTQPPKWPPTQSLLQEFHRYLKASRRPLLLLTSLSDQPTLLSTLAHLCYSQLTVSSSTPLHHCRWVLSTRITARTPVNTSGHLIPAIPFSSASTSKDLVSPLFSTLRSLLSSTPSPRARLYAMLPRAELVTCH